MLVVIVVGIINDTIELHRDAEALSDNGVDLLLYSDDEEVEIGEDESEKEDQVDSVRELIVCQHALAGEIYKIKAVGNPSQFSSLILHRHQQKIGKHILCI
jgi:hypothetical protein